MNLKDPIRKNLLDLNFQRYNSLLNTTIIISFTLTGILITVFVALSLSGRFDLSEIIWFFVLVGVILGIVGYFLIEHFNQKISDIKKELRRIREESKHDLKS